MRYPEIEIIHCSIPSTTMWLWSLTISEQLTLGTHAHWLGNMAIQSSIKINSKDLLHSCCLWELGRDRSVSAWFEMKVWIMSFYIILMFENVILISIKKTKPTGRIQWHKKGHCRALFMFFIFFLIKGRWCLWCWSLYKSNILSEKTIQPVTTYSEEARRLIQFKIR